MDDTLCRLRGLSAAPAPCRFAMDGTLISAVRNQQAFVDFQDCKSLSGCGVMLCSGDHHRSGTA